jgi:hypothetical protein
MSTPPHPSPVTILLRLMLPPMSTLRAPAAPGFRSPRRIAGDNFDVLGVMAIGRLGLICRTLSVG